MRAIWTGCALMAVMVFAAGCNTDNDGDGTQPVDSGPPASTSVLPVVAPYSISLWATAPSGDKSPDAIEYDGPPGVACPAGQSCHVWVAYQNNGTKDCGGVTYANQAALISASVDAGLTSAVVEYDLLGNVLQAYQNIPGHVDGMRYDPVTKLIWVTGNEDGCATWTSINPSSQTPTNYTGPGGALIDAAHGGGYDDLAFTGGVGYVADSAPTASGTFPHISSWTTNSAHEVSFTPVVTSTEVGYDYYTDAGLPLGLSDPDSMTVNPAGQLVLTSQGDNLLLIVNNPGASSHGFLQVVQVSDQLEDPTWIPEAKGQLLIADASAKKIFALTDSMGFTPGQIFTEAPNDSTLIDWLGTIDLTTMSTIGPSSAGFTATTPTITAIAVGFKKATGLLFIPQ